MCTGRLCFKSPLPPFSKGGKNVIPPLKKGDKGGFSPSFAATTIAGTSYSISTSLNRSACPSVGDTTTTRFSFLKVSSRAAISLNGESLPLEEIPKHVWDDSGVEVPSIGRDSISVFFLKRVRKSSISFHGKYNFS